MNVWKWMLRISGWSVEITAPHRSHCVICVAPHTSTFDFILGLAAYRSLGREANFLMKKFWFFFPLKYILRGFGGIPVERSRHKGTGLTEQIISDFRHRDYLNLAVTPEGTRSRVSEWHTGFLRIAIATGVPVQLGVIDYSSRRIIIRDEYNPTGDIDTDMRYIKNYYAQYANAAKYPEKFTIS